MVLYSGFSDNKPVYEDGEEQMRFPEWEALNIIAKKSNRTVIAMQIECTVHLIVNLDKFLNGGIMKAPFHRMIDSSLINGLSIDQSRQHQSIWIHWHPNNLSSGMLPLQYLSGKNPRLWVLLSVLRNAYLFLNYIYITVIPHITLLTNAKNTALTYICLIPLHLTN